MIWQPADLKMIAVIKAYLNKQFSNKEEKNTLIATRIVENAYDAGLYISFSEKKSIQ